MSFYYQKYKYLPVCMQKPLKESIATSPFFFLKKEKITKKSWKCSCSHLFWNFFFFSFSFIAVNEQYSDPLQWPSMGAKKKIQINGTKRSIYKMFMPFVFAVIIVGALHFLFERSNLVLLQWFSQRLERHIKWCRLYCRCHAIYSMCMKCYIRLTTTIIAIAANGAFHENLKKYLQVLITRQQTVIIGKCECICLRSICGGKWKVFLFSIFWNPVEE